VALDQIRQPSDDTAERTFGLTFHGFGYAEVGKPPFLSLLKRSCWVFNRSIPGQRQFACENEAPNAMKLRRMILGLAIALALSPAGQPAPAPAPAHLKIDYMFVIDVSASMKGAVGHPNIFPAVKNAIAGFITKLDPGTTVYFVPFAEQVREIRPFVLHGPDDVAVATAYLNALDANGLNTAIYNSLRDSMDYMKSRRPTPEQAAANPLVIHVYTDGDDNVSQGLTLEGILKEYNLRRGPHDWLFYTELGLSQDPQRAATFNSFDNVRYVAERVGEVRPISVVEARLPFMNFGNVMETQSPERDQQFIVRGTQPLPANFRLRVEPTFDKLRAAGVLVDIEPERFSVANTRIKWKLTLSNVENLGHGVYDGKLTITPSDPLVIVVPDDIIAVFSYEPPKKIVFSAAPGEHLPIAFGEVAPGQAAAAHLRVAADEEAQRAKIPVTFHIADLSANPARLLLGSAVYIDGQRGKRDGALAAPSEVTVVVQPPPNVPAGDYSGTIDVSAPEAQISYEGGSTTSATLQIPWRFQVPPPPTPWWVWVIVACATVLAILLFAYVATRPPRFPDLQLQLLKPRRGTIDLSGLSKKSFGPSTDVIPDCKVDFSIVARKRDGGGVAALIETDSNDVSIRRRGRNVDIFQQEELHSGDVIVVDQYELQVESTALNEA
jgi:hypothetical protein